jgi:hypothetical protein
MEYCNEVELDLSPPQFELLYIFNHIKQCLEFLLEIWSCQQSFSKTVNSIVRGKTYLVALILALENKKEWFFLIIKLIKNFGSHKDLIISFRSPRNSPDLVKDYVTNLKKIVKDDLLKLFQFLNAIKKDETYESSIPVDLNIEIEEIKSIIIR